MKIEKCKIIDKQLLVSYINDYWQQNHILVKNQDLLNWQHLNNSFYNFYVFKNDNKICGIIGFIPTSQYDTSLANNKDYFGAIWSVNKLAPPAAGHFLIKKMIDSETPGFIGFVGISEQSKVFYKKWNLEINFLHHYFIINKSFKKYKILKSKVNQDSCLDIESPNSILIKIENLSELKLVHKYKPEKTINYLINRYQNHPVYKYLFYGLKDDKNNFLCIFIIRKQIYLDRSCLRVIDIYGDIDNIESLKKQFENLLYIENAEYLDVLNFGISEEIFKKMGFSKLDFSSDNIIIPNFFQPFIQKNIKIEFSYISKYDEFVIYRGDGDQDRPS